MDIVQAATPENISLVANVALIAIIAQMKRVPALIKAATRIRKFMAVISQVSTLLADADKALSDGTLTPEESTKLLNDIKTVVNSKDVQDFLG